MLTTAHFRPGAILTHIGALPGSSYQSYEDATLAELIEHPFGVAIFLSILLTGFLPPLKFLQRRLGERLRPRLSRCKTPLLVQASLFLPFLVLLVLSAAAEDFILDGTTPRLVGLLAAETVVCSALWMVQRAVTQALQPDQPSEDGSAHLDGGSLDEDDDFDNPDDFDDPEPD